MAATQCSIGKLVAMLKSGEPYRRRLGAMHQHCPEYCQRSERGYLCDGRIPVESETDDTLRRDCSGTAIESPRASQCAAAQSVLFASVSY